MGEEPPSTVPVPLQPLCCSWCMLWSYSVQGGSWTKAVLPNQNRSHWHQRVGRNLESHIDSSLSPCWVFGSLSHPAGQRFILLSLNRPLEAKSPSLSALMTVGLVDHPSVLRSTLASLELSRFFCKELAVGIAQLVQEQLWSNRAGLPLKS